MSAPIEIHSVAEWNATLLAAKAQTPQTPVVAMFYAPWCGPSNEMAPLYLALADQHPHVQFLRVNVADPEATAIGAFFGLDGLPTFIGLHDGIIFDHVQGTNPHGVADMVDELKRTVWKLSPEAEQDKVEGNTAFAARDYKSAIAHYSAAIEKAPRTAVLYSNRAISYLKLSEEDAAKQEHSDSQWNHRHLRASAFHDASFVLELDVRWGKGWYRFAQVMLAVEQDASGEDVAPEHREEGARKARDAVIAALAQAVALTEGRAKTEAEALQRAFLDGV
ncbi:thioredoxin-domain-containing protein [Peniophora sp. CONT]|nr:thioredoxin-domain-containing protein [Peniophora sp. CONT]